MSTFINHPNSFDRDTNNPMQIMKTIRNLWLALSATLLLGTPFLAISQIQIPAAINYQGRLTDTLGNPLGSGYYEIEFRIWDDAVQNGAGNLVWGRSFALHVVTDGLFNILLTDDGGIISSPSTPTNTLLSAFGGEDRYLGLTITVSNGVSVSNSEISPRQQLASAPFAIQAQAANSVVPGGVQASMLQDESVTTPKISTGGVTAEKIADNAVTTAKIASGAVTTAKIGDSQVTTTKIANGAVTAAKLNVDGDVHLNDHNILLRGGSDTNHGVGWFGSGKTFAGINVDGPALYGFSGGVLGTTTGGQKPVLSWSSSTVGIGTLTADRPLAIKGSGSDGEWLSFKDTSDNTIWHLNNKSGGLNLSQTGVKDGMLFLSTNGNVGIGTLTPTKGILEVDGSVDLNPQNQWGGYGYLNRNSPTGKDSATTSGHYSIYASDRIAAVEFNAFSDARLKQVHSISDGRQDLRTLLSLQITDYTMRDQVKYGNQQFKKVVAQQVEQVYPQAVTTNITEVVPDIYVRSEADAGWIPLDKKLQPVLKVGDRVRLIQESGSKLFDVTGTGTDGFRVDQTVNGPVFVYGREVHDFRTVDYEAISMLNVSATQELYHRLVASEQEVAKLQNRVAAMEARELKQQARFTALEKLVHESRNGVQQASLK